MSMVALSRGRRDVSESHSDSASLPGVVFKGRVLVPQGRKRAVVPWEATGLIFPKRMFTGPQTLVQLARPVNQWCTCRLNSDGEPLPQRALLGGLLPLTVGLVGVLVTVSIHSEPRPGKSHPEHHHSPSMLLGCR